MLASAAGVTFAFLCVIAAVIAVVQLFRRKWKSLGIWAGVSLVSFVIVGVAPTAGVPTSSVASSSTNSRSNKATAIGGLSYSIEGVRVTSSIGGTNGTAGPAKANGEFILVRLLVSNVGHGSATVDTSDIHLRHGNSTLDASSDYMIAVILGEMSPAGFSDDAINPGTSRSGTVAFDAPAHTSPSQYELLVSDDDNNQSISIRL
jgi:hypothetical protein